MPILKAENIGAINWGLVAGKTNTMYAWDTPMPDGSEPKLWFHEIFRKDGTPYKQEEVDLIKKLTGKYGTPVGLSLCYFTDLINSIRSAISWSLS